MSLNQESYSNQGLGERIPSYKIGMGIFIGYIYILGAFAIIYFIPQEHKMTMFFYTLIILSSVLFAWFGQISKSTFFYNVNMSISLGILYFIYGFRNYSGIDDTSYIRIFYEVKEIGWFNRFKESTMEPGYLILNDLIGVFTTDYFYVQLITSFIPLFLFYVGFKKYRDKISIPTAVFLLCSMLYFQMLSVALVRMFIGISIVFIAFDYIPQKRPKKYISLILLASLFHYSAFFMIILSYFAMNRNNLSQKVARVYTIIFISSPFLFLIIGKYLVPLLGRRYINYGSIEGIDFSITAFTTLPLLMLLLIFYRKFSGEEQLYFKLFVFVFAMSLLISVFGSMINLGRLIFYSYAAFIVAAAMVSRLLNRNSIKLLYLGVIISYGFLYVYSTQFKLDIHIPYLFPYENIFFTL